MQRGKGGRAVGLGVPCAHTVRRLHCGGMDWSAALPTLLGTVVGASITQVADRIRWRRDQDQRRQESRREAYAAYLAALHAGSEAIRAVSLADHVTQDSRLSAAREAFGGAGLRSTREQLVLLAPESVVRVADEAFRTLRELRELVGKGHDVESPDYQQTLTRYQAALKASRNRMRADLGTPALGDDVTF
jgi:hypothetical protein